MTYTTQIYPSCFEATSKATPRQRMILANQKQQAPLAEPQTAKSKRIDECEINHDSRNKGGNI